MRDPAERGFSLIELAITVLVLGLLFAFSIPSFQNISSTFQLRGAAENVGGQLRLAREKALATGVEQPFHIPSNSTNVYHMHYSSGIGLAWTLPRGITFTPATLNSWYHLESDGRSQESGVIVLQNTRGNLDTVSVQLSGLILTR